jgi:hypothetical protein
VPSDSDPVTGIYKCGLAEEEAWAGIFFDVTGTEEEKLKVDLMSRQM